MANTNRPNILHIMVDQMRFDVLGVNGSQICRTPTLDRLAQEGVNYAEAYTPAGICSPARASMVTGRYSHNHGIYNNCHMDDSILVELPPEEVTYGELLNGLGYRLGHVGKWHIGRENGPTTRGSHDVGAQSIGDYRRQRGIPVIPPTPPDAVYATYPNEQFLISGTEQIPEEGNLMYYFAEEGMRLLREYDDQQPFYLRVDFNGPHHPYVVPEPWASLYDPQQIPPWPNFYDTLEKKPQVHTRHKHHRGVQNFTWEDWQPAVAKYFGYVSFLDSLFAKLLQTLDNLGIRNETLVIFNTDHGDFTGSHGQFNKGPLLYQEVYHIPMVMRWPGQIPVGTTTAQFVSLIDIMPTILRATDLPIPENIDGKALQPLWRDPQHAAWRDTIGCEFHGDECGLFSSRLIRYQHYKFVYNPHAIDELYDLERDPHELENRFDDPAYREIRHDLQRRLLVWMNETTDPWRHWAAKWLPLT